MSDEQNTNYDPKTEYWAKLDIEDLLPVLMDKVKDYYERLEGCGLLELWRLMYNLYYGLSESSGTHESSKITFIGDNDEGIKVRSGHMANIIQHIYISATGQEPNFIARAVNNDYKSKAQTYSAKSVLEYFLYEKNFVEAYMGAAETSLVFSRGYVYQGWDLIENEAFAVSHTPMTIISDLSNRRPSDPLWYIVVERTNKWDIVAKYDIPEDEVDELDCQKPDDDYFVGFEDIFGEDDDGDYINVYHFYHRKSPAVPDGRYVAFVNEKVSLYPTDDKTDRLPYAELPVYMIEPRRMMASPHSYSVSFDLGAHEKLHNIALSTIHTQLNKYGKKIVYGPKNPNYATDTGELEYIGIEEGSRPPGILDMTEVSESLFKVMEMEQGQMETLSAITAAIRGNTEGQKSGSHAALLHSVAVQFQTGFHRSYNKLLEKCGTGLLRLLKEFFEEEKMIEIVGADGESFLKAFTRDDISRIDRVVVENGPSVLRSLAGKLHFADSMLEKGMITSPEEYQEVLDTGQLQGVLTPGRRKNSGIQAENELLMNPEELNIDMITQKDPMGMEHTIEVVREVRAIIVDDDPIHIQEHANLILDPTHRQNEALVKAVLVHIAEHVWNAKYGSQDMIIALGKQPFPAGPPPPGPGVPPTPPQGAPQPQKQEEPPAGPLTEQNLQQQSGSVPDPNYPTSGMPGLPQNPIA